MKNITVGAVDKNVKKYIHEHETSDWDHISLWNQLTELIIQVRNRLIFVLTFIQTDFFLQPVESPPAAQWEEYRLLCRDLCLTSLNRILPLNCLWHLPETCWGPAGVDTMICTNTENSCTDTVIHYTHPSILRLDCDTVVLWAKG